jgi:hypothetical protein
MDLPTIDITGTFLKIIPTISMPNRAGSLILANINPKI